MVHPEFLKLLPESSQLPSQHITLRSDPGKVIGRSIAVVVRSHDLRVFAGQLLLQAGDLIDRETGVLCVLSLFAGLSQSGLQLPDGLLQPLAAFDQRLLSIISLPSNSLQLFPMNPGHMLQSVFIALGQVLMLPLVVAVQLLQPEMVVFVELD